MESIYKKVHSVWVFVCVRTLYESWHFPQTKFLFVHASRPLYIYIYMFMSVSFNIYLSVHRIIYVCSGWNPFIWTQTWCMRSDQALSKSWNKGPKCPEMLVYIYVSNCVCSLCSSNLWFSCGKVQKKRTVDEWTKEGYFITWTAKLRTQSRLAVRRLRKRLRWILWRRHLISLKTVFKC